jgi:Fic family protein
MTLKQLHKFYFSEFQKTFEKIFASSDLFSTSDNTDINFDYLVQVSSLFSSKIEGNSLDINSYFNQINVSIKSKSKEFAEVFDLASSYQFAQKNYINESNFLKVHKVATSSFLEKFQAGKYRNGQVGVFGATGIIYMAIEPDFIQKEMKSLFTEIKYFLNQNVSTSEAFFLAGLLHIKIAQIHPFVDGNGRMARLLEKWFLSNFLGEKIWSLQPEKYIFENREKYYSNINFGLDYYNLDYSKTLSFLEFMLESYL